MAFAGPRRRPAGQRQAPLRDDSATPGHGKGAGVGMPRYLQRAPVREEQAETAADEVRRAVAPEPEPDPPGAALESALQDTGGKPLPEVQRRRFEAPLGTSLSGVRVHTDATAGTAASAIRARAFTHGEHVYFAPGNFAPDTAAGSALLGHELTHVAQDRQGRVENAPGLAISHPEDPLEREAEAAGQLLAAQPGSASETPAGEPAATPRRGPPAPALSRRESSESRRQPLSSSPPDVESRLEQVPEAVDETPVGGEAPAAAPEPAAETPTQGEQPASSPATGETAAGETAAGESAGAQAGQAGQAAGAASAAQGGMGEAAQAPVPAPIPSVGELAPLTPPVPVPVDASASEARRLAAAVAAGVGAHGQALAEQARTAGQAVLEAIRAETEQHRARLAGAAQAARAEIAGVFAARRAAIQARHGAARGQIQGQRAQRRAQIQAGAAASRAQARAGVEQQRGQARTSAQTSTASIQAAGEQQAQRALSGSETSARGAAQISEQVQGSGDAARADAQRESAGKIAGRAAEGVRDNGRDMAGEARRNATEVGQGLDDELSSYLSGLDDTAASVEGHQATMAQHALGQVEGIAAQSLLGLDGLLAASLAQLQQAEQASIARLDAQVQQQLDGAGEAARQLMAALQAQLGPMVNAFTTVASEAQPGLAQLPLTGEHSVYRRAAALRAELDAAHAEFSAALDGLRAGTSGELGGLFGEALSGLAQAKAQILADAGAAAQEIGGRLDQLAAGAAGSLGTTAAQSVAAMQDGTATVSEGLAAAGSEFDTGTQETASRTTEKLGEEVSSGLAQNNEFIGEARGEASGAASRIGSKYNSLKNEAERRNEGGTVQGSWLGDAWNSVTGFLGDLADSVRQWFLSTFGDFWGGLLYGILSGLVMVAIAFAAGALLSLVMTPFAAAVVLIAAGAALGIYNRFREFYNDNPGEDAGFWRGLGLVGLGIADLTGIPFMVEGIVGQRAFGAEMTTAERTERFGMGLVFLGATVFAGVRIAKSRSGRGRAPGEGGERAPAEGGERAPAEGGERAPVEGGERAPAEGGERAPAEGGERAPAEGGERAPAEGGERAPAEGGERAPAEGGERAPGEGERAPGEGERAPGEGERAPGEGERAPGPDVYEELGNRRNLEPDVVEALRESGADPAATERLLDAGMDPADIALHAMQYGPDGVLFLDTMINAGVNARTAADALRIADNIGAAREVIDLVNSGNLDNPASLRNFLREVAAELAAGQEGKLTQLQEAAARAGEGNRVAIEGRRQVPGDPESGQADVIDFTAREALQMKVVTSATADGVVRNCNSAINQLGGAGGELPPQGFKRIADIRIQNPDNPMFNMDRAGVQGEIRGEITNPGNLDGAGAAPGELRITNNTGTHSFGSGEL